MGAYQDTLNRTRQANVNNNTQVANNVQQDTGGYNLRNMFYDMFNTGGNNSATASNLANQYGNWYNQMEGQTSYLADIFKQQSLGNNPALDKMKQTAMRDISKSTQQGMQTAKENIDPALARSGMMSNTVSDLYSGQANAQANVDAQVGQLDQQWRQQAIANLLGLQQQQFGNFSTMFNSLQNAKNQNQAVQLQQQAQQGSDFWDVLGNIAGTGLGIAGGNVLGGLLGGNNPGGSAKG